jgi:hypothetical protein
MPDAPKSAIQGPPLGAEPMPAARIRPLPQDTGGQTPRREDRSVAFETTGQAGDSIRISLAALVKELDSLGMGEAAIALGLGIEEATVREYLGQA